MVFGFGIFYCVCAFKCNLYVGMFKKVGDFPDFRAVVGENCPFIISIFGRLYLGFVLHLGFQIHSEFQWEVIFTCNSYYVLPFNLLSFCCKW
jgi:hypothetical protein